MSARFTAGRLRRRCPDCGVEVDVAKPAVVLSADSTRNARKTYSDMIRFQILWPALCEECAGFWNGLCRRILVPPSSE